MARTVQKLIIWTARYLTLARILDFWVSQQREGPTPRSDTQNLKIWARVRSCARRSSAVAQLRDTSASARYLTLAWILKFSVSQRRGGPTPRSDTQNSKIHARVRAQWMIVWWNNSRNCRFWGTRSDFYYLNRFNGQTKEPMWTKWEHIIGLTSLYLPWCPQSPTPTRRRLRRHPHNSKFWGTPRRDFYVLRCTPSSD